MAKAVELKFTGGKAALAKIQEIARRLGKEQAVRVGFLEKAKYPAGVKSGGLSVAQVAFWNEFGRPEHNQPPRAFFRNAIAKHSPEWGKLVAAAAHVAKYDSHKTLTIVGGTIRDQVVHSITILTSPPLAPATVKRKGFDKPLIETSVMENHVDYEVFKP